MKKYSPNLNIEASGFTLLEMLFAVIIFSFALISLMGIASKGVIATATARDQLTAQYLAEEGLEVARNMRDSNFLGYLSNTSWLDEIENCTKNSPCDITYSSTTPRLVPVPPGDYLYENEFGVYRRSDDGNIGGESTTFWREVYIDDPEPGMPTNQKKMVSTVHWKQKAFDRSYTMQTYISDWQNPSQ